jgi:hypothetical protein
LKAVTSVTTSPSTNAATSAESEKNPGKMLQKNFSKEKAGMRRGGTLDPSYIPCSFRALPSSVPLQYSKKVSFVDPSYTQTDGTNSKKMPYNYSKFYKGRKEKILPPEFVSNNPDDFESVEISSISSNGRVDDPILSKKWTFDKRISNADILSNHQAVSNKAKNQSLDLIKGTIARL